VAIAGAGNFCALFVHASTLTENLDDRPCPLLRFQVLSSASLRRRGLEECYSWWNAWNFRSRNIGSVLGLRGMDSIASVRVFRDAPGSALHWAAFSTRGDLELENVLNLFEVGV